MLDPVINFGKVIVSTGYNSSATSIVLQTGGGARLPNPLVYGSFNLTWWNSTDYPDPSDDPSVEIVRVTNISTDTLTITREQEGTSASDKNTVGKAYKMILAPTKKTMDDIQKFSIVTNQADFAKQSFTNLLKNGNFDSWSAGITYAPDGWTLESGTILKSSDTKLGTYSAACTSQNGSIRQDIPISSIPLGESRSVTFGAWVKSSTTRTAIAIHVNGLYGAALYHSGSGNYEFLTVTRIITETSGNIEVRLYPAGDLLPPSVTVYISGSILVEGSLTPSFSPRPLVNDGKTLTIDSINNRIGINNISPTNILDVTGNIAINGVFDPYLYLNGTGGNVRIKSNLETIYIRPDENGTVSFFENPPGGPQSVSINTLAADSINTLRNSSSLDFNAKYWTGSESSVVNAYIKHIVDSTAPISRLSFSVAGTEVLSLKSYGNVGIGTTNPSVKLEIGGVKQSILNFGTDRTFEPATFASLDKPAYGTYIASDAYTKSYYGLGQVTGGLGIIANDPNSVYANIQFFTGNLTSTGGSIAERLRITSDGRVGIGTSNPSSLLHVEGDIVSTSEVGAVTITTRSDSSHVAFVAENAQVGPNYRAVALKLDSTFPEGVLMIYNGTQWIYVARMEINASPAFVILNTLKTNTINEVTADAGVTIDGVLIKDGLVDGVYVFAHAAATGNLVHGLGTISTQNSNNVAITGGSVTALSALSMSNNQFAIIGFDLILGAQNQVDRGDTGVSRALVKDATSKLVVNFANDFSGGTEVQSNLNVTGNITTPGTVDGVDISTIPFSYVNVSGDTVTGVLTQNGANLAGTAYQTQSFQNLLKNGNFESWSAGTDAAPDGWLRTTWNGATPTSWGRSATHKFGTYGIQITAGIATLSSFHANTNVLVGQTFTFGAWIKTDGIVGTGARLVLSAYTAGFVYIGDIAASSGITGTNDWQFITVTGTMPATTGILTTHLTLDGTGTAYYDGTILVEGAVVPAFSERPLFDDGKTLTVDSVNNRVGIGATPTVKFYVQEDTNGIANLARFFNINTGINALSEIYIGQEAAGYHSLAIGTNYASGSSYGFLRMWGYSDANSLIISNNGRVGIGTVVPSEMLDVTGNIAVSGTVDGVDVSAIPSTYVNVSGDTMTGKLILNQTAQNDLIDLYGPIPGFSVIKSAPQAAGFAYPVGDRFALFRRVTGGVPIDDVEISSVDHDGNFIIGNSIRAKSGDIVLYSGTKNVSNFLIRSGTPGDYTEELQIYTSANLIDTKGNSIVNTGLIRIENDVAPAAGGAESRVQITREADTNIGGVVVGKKMSFVAPGYHFRRDDNLSLLAIYNDGRVDISGNVTMASGKTVDGVDISTIPSTYRPLVPRVTSITSSITPTPNIDTTDQYVITALATTTTFGAPTGTPNDGQKLTIRIKDNATAQTLSWNAIYRAGTDIALPTTTVISKTMYLGFIYNSTDSKWDLVASMGNI